MKIKIPHYNLIWVIRYWLGIMMVYHSYWFFFEANGAKDFTGYLESNGFVFPQVQAIIAKSVEFFGGLLLILGLWTRFVSFMIALVFCVIVFYMHKGLIWSEGELAFNYLLMAIILFFNPEIPFQFIKFKKINNYE